jgi:hypothetical protein
MQTPDNTSRLRHEIDSGRTGDKVDFVDPAAAPLGTDEEAGGRTPAPAEVASDAAPLPPRPRHGMRRDQAGVLGYALVAGAVCVAIVGIVALTV